jgi:ribonuclease HI
VAVGADELTLREAAHFDRAPELTPTELQLRALKAGVALLAPDGASVTLFTDNGALQRTWAEWIPRWQAHDYTTRRGTPVHYARHYKALLAALDGRSVHDATARDASDDARISRARELAAMAAEMGGKRSLARFGPGRVPEED